MEVILAGYWADKYMSKSNIGLNHAPIASIDFGPRRRRLTHDGPVYDVAHGHWDTRFDQVADALAEEIATGAELGATIAVDIDGELVVDIWGGHADRAKTVPWGKDTIVNFFSCTKTLTALASLILVDRGPARSLRTRRQVLAGVRRERQTECRSPPSDGSRVWGIGLGAPFRYRRHVRLGQATSPVRRRGGHPAPRPGITPLTMGI
jgi:Beta-lactamase